MDNMINSLRGMLPYIFNRCNEPEKWESLVINRRKPHTYRLWSMFDEYRVCLHRFDTCQTDEAFSHPHPWPAAFLILDGEYDQYIGYSPDLISPPVDVVGMRMTTGSAYQITSPNTWHRIVPRMSTHTVMLNGEPFQNPHKEVRTTKGKDLDKMERDDIIHALGAFQHMIKFHLK